MITDILQYKLHLEIQRSKHRDKTSDVFYEMENTSDKIIG